VSVRFRLMGSFAANCFGYAVTIIVQFGPVAILLVAWGPSLYGEWLLASTIPNYLGMSDLGLSSVLGNEMVLAVARNDRKKANAAFQSIGLVLLTLGPIVFTLVFVFLTQFPIATILGIKSISPNGFVSLIGLLLIQLWLGQQIGVIAAGFRCAGYYPLSMFLNNLSRLLEFLSLAAAAYMGNGPIRATVVMISVRVICLVGLIILLRLMVPWLRFGTNEARINIIRSMLRPGFAFLMFPISNAISMQTPLLIIGALIGPNAVAAFATTRTISRAIQQLTNIINNSVWPEMSFAFGKQNLEMLKRLFRLSVITSIWIGLFGAVVLAVFGPSLYKLWTHQLVVFDPVLFDLLLIVMVVNTLWFTASFVLAAINRVTGLASAYFFGNFAAAPICYALGLVAGTRGIALGLIFCEIAIAFYVLPVSFHVVRESFADFVKAFLSPYKLLELIRSGSIQ